MKKKKSKGINKHEIEIADPTANVTIIIFFKTQKVFGRSDFEVK